MQPKTMTFHIGMLDCFCSNTAIKVILLFFYAIPEDELFVCMVLYSAAGAPLSKNDCYEEDKR